MYVGGAARGCRTAAAGGPVMPVYLPDERSRGLRYRTSMLM